MRREDRPLWFKKCLRFFLSSLDISLGVIALIARTLLFKRRKIKRSVLLKNLGGIGDYVMLTASFEGYRALFSESKIVLLVRSDVVEFAQRNQYVDYVITVDYNKCRNNLFHRLKLWRALLDYEFEVFVNLDYSTTHENLDSAIARWSFARRKIGHHCLDRNSVRAYQLYDIIIPHQIEWMFEIERNNEMVRQLGLPSYNNFTTHISEIERFEYSQGIKSLLPLSAYYVVAPGSLLKDKCWPTSKYSSLIDRLTPWGFEVAICGAADEIEAASEIVSLSRNQRPKDLTGKTSLVDFTLLIRDAAFIICNDSSAAHIAQAVGTRAFVILGGGHYGRFLPYPDKRFVHTLSMEGMDCFYCYWICRYEYFKCVKDIEVEFVCRQICSALGKDLVNGGSAH